MRQTKGLEKGLNSDVVFSGSKYHIQTEDWGLEKATFVTQIFANGALIRSIKVPYTKVLTQAQMVSSQKKIAIETQHQSVIEMLLSGQLIRS